MDKKQEENFGRTLRQLAVIDAWFDPVLPGDGSRFSLHMNVAFREERLGGGVDEPVRFRLTLKRCEVVVVTPRFEPDINVDPRTIARKPPSGSVTVKKESSSSASASGSADVGLSAAGVGGGLKAGVAGEAKRSTSVSSSETLPSLDAMHSRSADGYPCWAITTTVSNARLIGSLWDPHTEPRLHVVDGRPQSARDREARTKLYPSVTVEIRCKREDMDITDIELTDESEQAAHLRFFGTKKRTKAAEAFIKAELEREGLKVSNISEMFSDLVVADRIVPLKS